MTGGAIGQVVPFLLLPILTRYLAPESYGIVATFNVLMAIAVPFVGLNIQSAATRSFFDLNKKEFSMYVGNGLFLVIFSFCLFSIVFFIFRHELAEWIKFPSDWLLIVPVVALGQVLINEYTAILRVMEKAVQFTIFNLGVTVSNMLFSLLMVVGLPWDWKGRVLGISASILIFGIIGLVILAVVGSITLRARREYFHDTLQIGLPLIPHALGNWGKTMVNRLLINNMVGLKATGLYSVGYTLGSVLSLFQSGFHNAWIPWLYARLKSGKTDQLYRVVHITYAMFIVNICGALVFARVCIWVLPYLVGDRFSGSAPYVFWIALGYAGHGMYFMVVGYMFYARKTHYLALITLATGLINVVLSYYFIRNRGPLGAAEATAVSFYIGFFMTWLLAMKAHPMPWSKALVNWKSINPK